MAMCPKRFSLKEPYRICMTIPETISCKHVLEVQVQTTDPALVVEVAGRILRILKEYYSKPEVLILP